MKSILFLFTLVFIYGCGAKESIVKIDGVLTPVEMKSKKGRGTGLRVVYSISSNLEIKLVTHGFRIGWILVKEETIIIKMFQYPTLSAVILFLVMSQSLKLILLVK